MAQLLMVIGTFLIDWVLPKLLAVGGTVAISVTVIQPIFSYLQNQVMSHLNGLSGDAVHFLQFVGVPDAISVIFAAYTMVFGLRAAKAAYQRSGSKT
jgi:hypothetical protein